MSHFNFTQESLTVPDVEGGALLVPDSETPQLLVPDFVQEVLTQESN